MQIPILAERRKSNFLALSGTESSFVQTFWESCVHFDFTHSSFHMIRRFVIQSFPTLLGCMKLYGMLHTLVNLSGYTATPKSQT